MSNLRRLFQRPARTKSFTTIRNLTLYGSAIVHGNLTAPAGTATLNGAVRGRVIADRLIISGTGFLEDPAL